MYKKVNYFLVLLASTLSYSMNGMGLDEQFGLPYTKWGEDQLTMPEQATLPKLSLYECENCQEEYTTYCTNCKGVYYCSRKCQMHRASLHKKNCKVIVRAHKGDVAQMRNFFLSYMSVLQRKDDKAVASQVADWHQRLFTCLRVNIACSYDKNMIDCIQGLLAIDKPHLRVLSRYMQQKEIDQKMRDAAVWVRNLIESGTMAPPHGIKLHTKGHFFYRADMPYDIDQLRDQKEWQQCRRDLIKEYFNLLPKNKKK